MKQFLPVQQGGRLGGRHDRDPARSGGCARPAELPRLLRLPRLAELPRLGLIAAVGTGADLAYLTASVRGTLSIVSAVSSLYPVATIALGRVLQGQRATRVQAVGITLALTGAVLLGFASR